MPSYLLRAPDKDMRKWRAAAASTGVPFSAYTREALDAYATSTDGETSSVTFHHGWQNVGGKTVPDNMVVLSKECHRGDHRDCTGPTSACECGCHG